ncbi:hypothetical protein GWI33_017908 [Rhynchophorus ferrugineus]|uniref:Uncharacterized protein n=1 Tax=Rhynchophorus ferrugineus TaxID=354439 RepID=A0A834HXE0_RHYFE|nr:hypothetical protein GWI33_017908 [Rhynchophorus ferrugineus]
MTEGASGQRLGGSLVGRSSPTPPTRTPVACESYLTFRTEAGLDACNGFFIKSGGWRRRERSRGKERKRTTVWRFKNCFLMKLCLIVLKKIYETKSWRGRG